MMKRLLWVLIPALLVLAGAQAFTPRSDAATATVMTKKDAKLGTILADAKGMTLYQFTKDVKANESACVDQCATAWPPLTVTSASDLLLASGIDGALATFKRADGTLQVSYNGIPLYHFAKDGDSGDAYGQGVGNVWFVVMPGAKFGAAASASPEGSPIASPASSPAAAAGSAIQIKNFAFAPASLEVAVGATVTWTNGDSIGHTVTADDKSFDSGTVDPGKSFTFTFTKAGTFTYHCSIHPNMTATIVVK
jgi:predicted lipoprotein with Yx(FWY)xxD motif/plastocyanin